VKGVSVDSERRKLRAWAAEVLVADSGSAGHPDSPPDLPIVVLHGEEGPESVGTLVDGLRETHRVLSITHPGFDRGPRVPGVDRPHHLAYLYLDLLDSAGITRCAVVGSSLGAWIAMEMAVMEPGRFASVTLLGPLGAKFNGREERSFAEVVVEAPDRIREVLYADGARDPWRDRSEPEQIVERAEYRETFMHYGWEPYLHNPTLPALLPRIGAPTLVLAGDEDRLAPPGYYEALAGRVAYGRLERVAGAGHYPEIERPEETVELIRKFALTGKENH